MMTTGIANNYQKTGRYLIFMSLSVFWVFQACNNKNTISYLNPSEKIVESGGDEMRYESGGWEEISYEKADTSWGNHRVVLEAPSNEYAVRVHIPW